MNWVTKRRYDAAVTITGQVAEPVAGYEPSTMSQVATAYSEARTWARRRTTFRLRRYEARAASSTQPQAFDQLRKARLKAVRDELGARGKRPAPHRPGRP